MEGKGGLIELIFVLLGVIGWGVLELVSMRLYKKRRAQEAAAKETEGRSAL